MSTLLLQSATTLLLLAFGITALTVARRLDGRLGVQRAAWLLSGIAFTAMAATKTFQDVGAVWAFTSGPGTAVYDAYLGWAPVANHGRTFLATAFHVLLAALAFRRTPPGRRFWIVSAVALAGAFLSGALVGWLEGSIISRIHYTRTSLFDAVAFVLLLGALFGALIANAMDRLLWTCIAIYAFILALGILWYAAMAWINTPGAWAPSPRHMHLYRTVLIAGMVGVAYYRLRLLRRGIPVPPLLQSSVGARSSLLG